jgi:hypothetical protein
MDRHKILRFKTVDHVTRSVYLARALRTGPISPYRPLHALNGGSHSIRWLALDRTAQPHLLGDADRVPAAERQISSARPPGGGLHIRSSGQHHPVAA